MLSQQRAVPRAAAAVLGCAAWLVFASPLGLAGCASTHAQLVEFLRAHEVEVSTGHYVVRPPDIIAIHSPDVAEVDGAEQTVRPDGKVVLRLLGDVDVAGLTTEEIAAKLKSLLARYYVDPEVIVEVAGYRSQFYYVFGEVSGAGPKLYTGRDTLLKALAEAQPTYLAWRSQITVLRPSANEAERKVITVDLDRMLKGGDLTQDFLLQDGDVIQVPPTPLAWIGHRIRELLYPVGPLMNAYTTPAAPIYATHAYEDEFGNDSGYYNRPRRQMPSYGY
jgi:polysaccharide export outer membrane protein